MLKKIIKVPLYPNRLGIIITDSTTINEVYSFLSQQGMTNKFNLECAATINGWINSDNGLSYKCDYVILNFSEEELSHGTITHEVIHFVNSIFTDIGANIDQHNDEPQAYLAQWATNEIYKFIEESGRKIKSNGG